MGQHFEFIAGLRAESQALREFHQILQTEQACLMRTDVDALLELTQLKSEKVDRLAELGTNRSAYLHSLGLDTGRQGVAQWLAIHGGARAPEFNLLWDELVELASGVRNLNEANGVLIATRMGHNQAALAALQSSTRAFTLYGPDGQSDLAPRHRELGQA